MEIPLQRGNEKSGGGKGLVIAFVDMDRIYRDFPETQKARQEYKEQADKMKRALSDKEEELSDLREQLSILRAAAEEGAKESTSTEAGMRPSHISDNLEDKERRLAEQEAALLESRKDAVQALSGFERKRAAQVFGKLYHSLSQLADEKGVDMVLDKSALLYGQGGMDLTEALSRRVRGLPELDKQ